MENLVRLIFVVVGMDRIAAYDSLQATGGANTAPVSHAHAFLARGAHKLHFCVLSPKTTIPARMSCFAPCFTRHLSRLHSAL